MLTQWLFPQLEEDDEATNSSSSKTEHHPIGISMFGNIRMHNCQGGGLGMPDITSSALGHRGHPISLFETSSYGVTSKVSSLSSHCLRICNSNDYASLHHCCHRVHPGGYAGECEWEYRLDVCRMTRGAHIECL